MLSESAMTSDGESALPARDEDSDEGDERLTSVTQSLLSHPSSAAAVDEEAAVGAPSSAVQSSLLQSSFSCEPNSPPPLEQSPLAAEAAPLPKLRRYLARAFWNQTCASKI